MSEFEKEAHFKDYIKSLGDHFKIDESAFNN